MTVHWEEEAERKCAPCALFLLTVVEARSAGVRPGKGWLVPSQRVHHRSPGVLAVSSPSHSGCLQCVCETTHDAECARASSLLGD